MIGLYSACLKDICENGLKALASVLTFLMMPEELFYPPYDTAVEMSEIEQVAMADAHAYYGLLLCLNYKLSIILEYTNVDKRTCCEDMWCSLYSLAKKIESWDCDDAALRQAIAIEADRCIGRARGAAAMLVAPRVTPDPVHSAATVDGQLSFELVTADILFHLTRTGSAGGYIQSGYADPSLFHADAAYTLDNMLGCYMERIRKCMQVCC